MSNILTAEVKIVGSKRLVWHAFGPWSMNGEKKERSGSAGNDPEEWRKSYLATKDGQLYVKPTYIFGCLRNGARYTKRGRGSLQTYVAATLNIDDDIILIDRFMPQEPQMDESQEVYIDVTGVRNPVTKSRNIRYRIATHKGWHATFHISWDKTVISRAEMEAVVIDSGKLCGLGDGRGVGDGRFELESFTVSE